MKAVQMLEEKAAEKGRSSLVTEAHKFACFIGVFRQEPITAQYLKMCKDLKLVDSVPPWYSPVTPKPRWETLDAQAFWNVPVYADHTCVKANRVDVRFVDQKGKKVWAVEMSCPWVGNGGKKDEEKTAKYGPLRWELRKWYPGYNVDQCAVILSLMSLEGGQRNLSWLWMTAVV